MTIVRPGVCPSFEDVLGHREPGTWGWNEGREPTPVA